MRSTVKNIPASLIYEMVDGQPIFYRGYKSVVSGEKSSGEIRGNSYLQALLVTELVIWLRMTLGKSFQVLGSELGLQFSPKSWRAADIAIFTKKQLSGIAKTNKYLDIPPQCVIEIDTMAQLPDESAPSDYHFRKKDDLLAFGVGRVVWIFTDSRKILIAEPGDDWRVTSWSQEVEIFNGHKLILDQFLAELE
ncbi:MAG: hypothetical protein SF052_20805 [Bacteroidia bacterium]|nr:hypothetical protein [Bacteroidia bacterium]